METQTAGRATDMLSSLPCVGAAPPRALREHVPAFMQRLAAEVGVECSCEMLLWEDAARGLDRGTQGVLEVFAAAAVKRGACVPVRAICFAGCPGEHDYPVTDIEPLCAIGVAVALEAGALRMHAREAFQTDVGEHTTALAQQQLDLPSFGDAACVLCEAPCALDATAGDHACDFWAVATAGVRGDTGRRTVLVHVRDALFAPAPHGPAPRVCVAVATPLSMLLGIVAAVDLLVFVLAPHKSKTVFPSAFAVPRMEELPVSVASLERVLQHYRPMLADAPLQCQEGLFASMVAFAAAVARGGGVVQRARAGALGVDVPPLAAFRAQLHAPPPGAAGGVEAFVAAMRRGRIRMLATARPDGSARACAASLEPLMCALYAPAHDGLASLIRRGLCQGVCVRGACSVPASQPRITSFVRWGAHEAFATAAADPRSREGALFALLGALHARFPAAHGRYFAQTLCLTHEDLARASEDEHVLLRLGFLAHYCASAWHALAPDAAEGPCSALRLVPQDAPPEAGTLWGA